MNDEADDYVLSIILRPATYHALALQARDQGQSIEALVGGVLARYVGIGSTASTKVQVVSETAALALAEVERLRAKLIALQIDPNGS